MGRVVSKAEAQLDAKVSGKSEAKGFADLMGSIDGRMQNLGKSMVGARLAGDLLTKAFHALNQAVGGVVKTGLNWEDWVGDGSRGLDRMASSIDNIINKLELQRSRMQLMQGDFETTETQMQAVAKAAVILARRTGGDATKAIDSLTTKLVSGAPQRVMRQLGINVDFVGTKSERMAAALKLLEERFGGMDVGIVNTNERIASMNAQLTNAVGKFTASIRKAEAFKKTMSGLTEALQGFAKWIEDAADDVEGARKKVHELNLELGREYTALSKFKEDNTYTRFLRRVTEEKIRQLEIEKTMAQLARYTAVSFKPTPGMGDERPWMKPKSVTMGGKKKAPKLGGKRASPKTVGTYWDEQAGTGGGEENLPDEEWEEKMRRNRELLRRAMEEDELRSQRLDKLLAEREALAKLTKEQKKYREEVVKAVTGPMQQFNAAIWDNVGAMVFQAQTAEQTGLKILGALFSMLGKMAMAESAKNVGLALSAAGMGNWAAFGKFMGSVAAWGVVGGIVGGAGAALTASASTSSSSSAEPEQPSYASSYSPTGPSFGTTGEKEQTTIVNVYLGEKDNPAAAWMFQRQFADAVRPQA